MKRNLFQDDLGRFVKVEVPTETTTRICSCCNLEKELGLFGNSKTGIAGKKGTCKKCESDASNRYNKRNRHKVRQIGRRVALRKLGLTPEQYEALLEAQGRSCAICGATKAGGKGAFPVDHCHRTGAVRGILCTNCNLVLGLVKDDSARLEKAAAYLRQDGYRMVTSRNAVRRAPA